MFGKRLRIEREDGWGVTLRPPQKEEVAALKEGVNEPTIAYATNLVYGVTDTMQEKYFDNIESDKDSIHWGIYPDQINEDETTRPTKLVGLTGLHKRNEFRVWSTGFIISFSRYWGFGIAGLSHICRTWYASEFLDVNLLVSEVKSGTAEHGYNGSFDDWKKSGSTMYGNWASRKALERVGYTCIYTMPAQLFRRGQLQGLWKFLWINPKKAELLFPNGIPKMYEKGLEKARLTLEKGYSMIKNV
jgi:RimJ/RimL family protein N-acetyltransferase